MLFFLQRGDAVPIDQINRKKKNRCCGRPTAVTGRAVQHSGKSNTGNPCCAWCRASISLDVALIYSRDTLSPAPQQKEPASSRGRCRDHNDLYSSFCFRVFHGSRPVSRGSGPWQVSKFSRSGSGRISRCSKSHGSYPAGFQVLEGRVGSAQEVFELSRVG